MLFKHAARKALMSSDGYLRLKALLSWRPSFSFLCATVCALLGLIFPLSPAVAQSTFSTILGTVTDESGATVPGATVKATNTDENTSHTVTASGSGDYEFVNTKPGHYKVEVRAMGFQAFSATGLLLIARQTLRVDVRLQISQLATATNVEATAGVIATDTPTIQSGLDSQALLSLPANIRASGSTSPYALIAVLPGVQPDDNGGYSIQGGIPSMSQFSLDGISITLVNANNPLSEAFPSLESIAEIKVQGVGNSAEFGEVGDVTTISKSGTNEFHGDLFWYHQNRALDATAYGQQTKPQKIGNDFGASAGGPLFLPVSTTARTKLSSSAPSKVSDFRRRIPFRTRSRRRLCVVSKAEMSGVHRRKPLSLSPVSPVRMRAHRYGGNCRAGVKSGTGDKAAGSSGRPD